MSTTEIAVEAKKVFGDSAVAARADSTGPAAPVWDIDVRSYETHARVEYFVKVFSGRAKEPFAKALQRQTRYGALIRGALRDGGLPEDLTYLALIESWYDPHAYSKAAAVGMWQFMTRTARGAGLRVDWWVDERRDPVRSTQGAVRLLRELKDQFGSIYLAAAAYDGGDGRIARGLARYRSDLDGVEGDDRFFTLAGTSYLRAETRDYVPKIIAAALVGKEPARYGVTVDSVAALAFDSVRVAGGTPLAAVGNAAGAPPALMRELNPHILRGATPPGEAMWVRVPAGSAATFDDRFAALDSSELRAFTRVESRKGESMASIARKHALTAKQLAWYNPKVQRLKSGNLVAGQRILVPSHATVAAALDVPDPSIEKFPRRAKATARKGSGGKAGAKKGSSAKKGKSATSGSAAKKATRAKKGSAAKKAPPKKHATAKKTPANS
ncbi:MAG: transglycosylase SLT domain-containing protein [Gemmatimonadetes bacterium]|nr:transglycosylase SLT domain-containing protein [Gemmatimonadota bacterium]MBI3568947.1 transglycosylase SLT domain-containing protein [Gemmatimonadota bacterium]